MLGKTWSAVHLTKRLYSGSTKIRAQKYVLTKYFQGEPKKTDFKIVEEDLPELQDGGNVYVKNDLVR